MGPGRFVQGGGGRLGVGGLGFSHVGAGAASAVRAWCGASVVYLLCVQVLGGESAFV